MAELDKNGADMTIEETFAALDDLIGRLEGGKPPVSPEPVKPAIFRLFLRPPCPGQEPPELA